MLCRFKARNPENMCRDHFWEFLNEKEQIRGVVTSLTAVHAYGLKFTDTQILNIDSDHGLKKKRKNTKTAGT